MIPLYLILGDMWYLLRRGQSLFALKKEIQDTITIFFGVNNFLLRVRIQGHRLIES